jgi:hypothetical protein
MFTFTRISTHPWFSTAAMTFIAACVNEEVTNDRMAGERLNTKTAAVLGKVAYDGSVSQNDSSIRSNTRGWCAGHTATAESQTAINIALHADQEILESGMAWDGACERVPSGFSRLGAVAEEFERDGEVFASDGAWRVIAFDSVVVIACSIGFHFFKKFDLKGS